MTNCRHRMIDFFSPFLYKVDSFFGVEDCIGSAVDLDFSSNMSLNISRLAGSS